jgi:hypothetical protein
MSQYLGKSPHTTLKLSPNCLIDNVPCKLSKNCQCPPRPMKRQNLRYNFSIKQKYPYKFKKEQKN